MGDFDLRMSMGNLRDAIRANSVSNEALNEALKRNNALTQELLEKQNHKLDLFNLMEAYKLGFLNARQREQVAAIIEYEIGNTISSYEAKSTYKRRR